MWRNVCYTIKTKRSLIMKKTRICKLVSFVMLLALLVTALPWMAVTSSAAAPSNYTNIYAGESKSVSVGNNGNKYFRFVPTVSGTYKFYSYNNGSSDPYGILLDSSGSQLTYSDDYSNRNFSIQYDLTAGRTYYLQAKCYGGGSGSYTVKLELVRALYTSITAGETKTVSINGNTQYFQFVPTVSGTYKYYSFNRTSGDPYGMICDSGFNTLIYNDDSSDNNFSMQYNLTAGTTYYVAAKCYSDGSGAYSIKIEPLRPTISVGETKSVSVSGDVKYFQFVPTVSGTYKYYSLNKTSGDPYGMICDSNFNVLTSNDDALSNNNFSMQYPLTAGTTYYLAAKCFSNGSGAYSIKIELVNATGGSSGGSGSASNVNGAGSYSLFRSGSSGSGRYYSSTANYNDRSYTNNGYDIYANADTSSIRTVNLGLSFTVTSAITERASVLIYAYDVDESAGERDLIYLKDETDGSRTQLTGYLSGRDGEWNTTTLQIPLSELQVGHTYHFELYESVAGWVVYVRTVDLQIAGQIENSTITDSNFNATIDQYGRVNTSLYLASNINTTYVLEYAASINYDQVGSSLGQTIATSPSGNTKNVSFNLESGAPEGTYTIEVYIKDAQGRLLMTLSNQAAYSPYTQYYAVNYNSNGGSNSVPSDVTSYESGDTATVKYDYIPTKAGYIFLGWSSDRNARVPEFTENGNNTFTIYDNVTLYAVWRDENFTVGTVTVESNVDTPVVQYDKGFYQTVEFYYVASDFLPIERLEIRPLFNSNVFEFVSAEWLLNADNQSIDSDTYLAISEWESNEEIDGNVLKLVLRATTTVSSTEVGAEIFATDENGESEVIVIAKSLSVIECPHDDYELDFTDDDYHYLVCSLCGYEQAFEHSFTDDCDTDCNGGCGYSRLPMHTLSSYWSSDRSHHWHSCVNCGETVEIYEHTYDSLYDYDCNDCYYDRFVRYDYDYDGDVDYDDVVYLLSHYFFREMYPIYQDGDVDGNGVIDPDDAIYLYDIYY